MRLCVLGSGTDAGKTWVTCRLLEDLRARGLAVRVRKPVVSGFVDDDASDSARLMRAAASTEALDVVSPWRFVDAVSPDEAARRAGVVVDFDAVVRACRAQHGAQHGVDVGVDDGVDTHVVVEAAGGVLSPLTEGHSQLDLARALGGPAIVVVDASYLGSISHGLTAVQVVMARGVEIAAVVVNRGPLEPFARFLPGVVVVAADDRAWLADRIWRSFRASRS